MGTISGSDHVGSTMHDRGVPPLVTAIEVLSIYAGILFYIWRWQHTHPYFWMVLLGMVMLSQLLYRDRLQDMGLTRHELGPCARVVFPLLVAIAIPAAIIALWQRDWVIVLPYRFDWLSFTAYIIWCFFQQYLMQSYFHRRLRTIIKTPHLSSLAVAIMFAGAHVPSPVLMVATLAGGLMLAEVFVRHPNVWPLALAQAIAGFLIAVLTPATLIHHMRVGPGYYFYNLR
jgi:hypothetical protein